VDVSGLKSGGAILDKSCIKCVMDGSKKTKRHVDKNEEVIVFREDSPTCSSFAIQNRSSAPVSLDLDFGKSFNVLINHPHTRFGTSLSAKSTMFLAHLIPEEPLQEHQVVLKESIAGVRP
jgi:hypothetical protein